MGCGSAKFIPMADDEIGQGPRCVKVLKEGIGLSDRDIDKLYGAFLATDINHDANVDCGEFVTRNKPDVETLCRLMIRLMDYDGSNKCRFQDYVLTFWSICSCSDLTLSSTILAFFDLDEKGEMDRAELIFLARLFTNFQPKPISQGSIKYIEHHFTRMVNLAELVHTPQCKGLFTQCIQMRVALQNSTLGLNPWRHITAQRTRKFGDKSSFEIIAQILGTTKDEVKMMKMRGLGREIPEQVYVNEHTPSTLKEKIKKSRGAAKKERDTIILARELVAKRDADTLQREKDKVIKAEKEKAEAMERAKGKRDKVKNDEPVIDPLGLWFNKTALQHQQAIAKVDVLGQVVVPLNAQEAEEAGVLTGEGQPADPATQQPASSEPAAQPQTDSPSIPRGEKSTRKSRAAKEGSSKESKRVHVTASE